MALCGRGAPESKEGGVRGGIEPGLGRASLGAALSHGRSSASKHCGAQGHGLKEEEAVLVLSFLIPLP